MTRFFAPIFLASFLATLATTDAHANEMTEAPTSYLGAVMLEGGVDVSAGGFGPGPFGRDKYDQSEYAFWSGNTMYAGAEDEFGNGVDAIVEFYWFDSSIDRGSDFYVAVIKARTTPNLGGNWALETDDEDLPVLYVSAETDISRGTGAFRWDWSVPFDNYGIESYGQVNMSASYGASVNGEGSAMAAKQYNEDGVQAEGQIQAKGNFDASYNVTTNYSVELWSWYMQVRGFPYQVEWSMFCNNFTLEDENAYHEYFLVIQSDEGVPFVLDSLTLGGSLDQWWWGKNNRFSVEVTDIVLTRPDKLSTGEDIEAPENPEDGEPGDYEDEDPHANDGLPTTPPQNNPHDPPNNGPGTADENPAAGGAPGSLGLSLERLGEDDGSDFEAGEGLGCSTAPASPIGLAWMLLPLAVVIRRRS